VEVFRELTVSEAAALGLPKWYQFRRIVLPQALRAIVPAYVNQLIGLIKGTSLVFYVSLLDLFGQGRLNGTTHTCLGSGSYHPGRRLYDTTPRGHVSDTTAPIVGTSRP